MRALSADHRRIFAGFEARIAARSSGDGFFPIGTAALGRIPEEASSCVGENLTRNLFSDCLC